MIFFFSFAFETQISTIFNDVKRSKQPYFLLWDSNPCPLGLKNHAFYQLRHFTPTIFVLSFKYIYIYKLLIFAYIYILLLYFLDQPITSTF